MSADLSRTASGVYECPGCGERLAGHRRRDTCTLFARRLDQGGCCPSCDVITVNELLNIQQQTEPETVSPNPTTSIEKELPPELVYTGRGT